MKLLTIIFLYSIMNVTKGGKMEQKYPELKGICKYCGGCNQLLNYDFVRSMEM